MKVCQWWLHPEFAPSLKTACYRAWNEETDDKLLPHALGNTVSHDGMNHDGKESQRQISVYTPSTTRCIQNHNMDRLSSFCTRTSKTFCASVWGKFQEHKNRNNNLRTRAASANCKHQKSVFAPSASLKSLCRTRGAPHLKPNFPFTDRVPSSRNNLTKCDQVQRINRNILSQKVRDFSYTSRGGFMGVGQWVDVRAQL